MRVEADAGGRERGGDGQCVRTQRGGVEAGRREAEGVERGDRGSSVGAASRVVLTRRGGGAGVAAGGEGEGEREGEGEGPVGRVPSWAGPLAAIFFLIFYFSYMMYMMYNCSK